LDSLYRQAFCYVAKPEGTPVTFCGAPRGYGFKEAIAGGKNKNKHTGGKSPKIKSKYENLTPKTYHDRAMRPVGNLALNRARPVA
jgi:hypothetical protein